VGGLKKSSWVEKFQMNISDLTISADVQVIDKSDYDDRQDLWISFYPEFSDGKNSLKMGRYYFSIYESKTIESQVLDKIIKALYEAYNFIEIYPYFYDYRRVYVVSDDDYKKGREFCVQLRNMVTSDLVDSILVSQKLSK
jgi:hypothetical protein